VSRRARGEAPEESEGKGSVAFLVLVLVLLAAVPVASTVWLSTLEGEVREVIDPAREAAEDLAAIHARQMLYFQEWLLTGEFAAQAAYRDLLRDEALISAALRGRVENAALDVQGLHLPVVSAAVEWQLLHVSALSESGRQTFLEGPAVLADQRRFETLLAANEALLDELNVRGQAARRRVATARDFFLMVTIGLVGFALIGTGVVAALSRRLRELVRDVRGRHRDALRARRELDAIVDATADAVVEVDADGKVARINPAATRLLGWSEEDARGERPERLLLGAAAPDGAESEITVAARAGRAVDAADGEVFTRRGERIAVLWSTRPLTDGALTRGVVVTLTDLTEIRAASEALRRAVRAREETLAVVSHDLRSPLATVQAVGELLLEVPLDSERRAGQLRNLLKAGDRMDRLIRDLLDLARIDGGGLDVRPESASVGELLEACVEAMTTRAEAAGVALVRGGSDSDETADDLRVLADRDRVLQVWENLVSNALRHTREGGEILLSAVARDEVVEFSVSDTGEGIPPEALPYLFERFWRPDQPRRDGSGLGLTIVRGIVEAHGGSVSVESEVGRGTTFGFSLPLSPPSTT